MTQPPQGVPQEPNGFGTQPTTPASVPLTDPYLAAPATSDLPAWPQTPPYAPPQPAAYPAQPPYAQPAAAPAWPQQPPYAQPAAPAYPVAPAYPYQPGVTVNVSQPAVLGANVKEMSGVVYLIITFFVGFLGVHRFMRGQIGLGILYLLTIGLLGFGVLVDFILSIVWVTQADPAGNIRFVNGKYAQYQAR